MAICMYVCIRSFQCWSSGSASFIIPHEQMAMHSPSYHAFHDCYLLSLPSPQHGFNHPPMIRAALSFLLALTTIDNNRRSQFPNPVAGPLARSLADKHSTSTEGPGHDSTPSLTPRSDKDAAWMIVGYGIARAIETDFWDSDGL